MKGDFSRDTFRQTATHIADPTTPARDKALRRRRYARVLQQQGRVQLDADWNEQVAIQTYLVRTQAADLIGRHGAPTGVNAGTSFKIQTVGASTPPNPATEGVSPTDLVISPGRYYVEGILCESLEVVFFTDQPDRLDVQPLTQGQWFVFLDVWERHLTAVEDHYLREVALGGPDTATRAQVVWQVFVLKINPNDFGTLVQQNRPQAQTAAMGIVDGFQRKQLPLMRARSQPKAPDEPCLLSPAAKYRGPENQLYRVEVHLPSPAGALGTQPTPGPTFKWSRDNGSVVYPIVVEAVATAPGLSGTTVVVVEHLGKDDRSRLRVGDWVEFVDDSVALGSRNPNLPLNPPAAPAPGVMRQVRSIEDRRVTLSDSVPLDQTRDLHPLLRRWETQDLPIPAPKPSPDNPKALMTDWIALEDGVEIQFCLNIDTTKLPAPFRTGDYWLVPARVATGDVEWPGPDPNGQPDYAPPRGIDHVYAPLAAVSVDTANNITATDLRMTFDPLATPV